MDIYRNIFVYWNGDVVPCCYDHHGSEIMGNVMENTMDEIWNGERYQAFRKKTLEVIQHPENEPEMCKSCLKWTHPSSIAEGEEYLEDDPDEIDPV